MSKVESSIAGKSLWTIGTYAASAGIRFSTNIVLSRLLGPEILGIVVVAQAVRAGAELLTDLGMEQNVVHSPHGNDETFQNTVWTMQIIRGALISVVCMLLSPYIAGFYRVEISLLVAMSLVPFVNSLTSTSVYTLSRNMDVKTRNIFELFAEIAGLAINVGLALLMKSVWAPIIGILLAVAVRSSLTYLLPHPRHRFVIDKTYGLEILRFSKWIMLSSFMLFCAVYMDRLFLGRFVSLTTLGIYGLARAISDLPQAVAVRLAFQIVFPFVARNRDGTDAAAQADLARTRRHFLVLVALGISTIMAWSDWAVHILYDRRYAEAGWMLFLLLGGSWIGVLASLNEATMFGRGKPQQVSLANLIRVVAMAVVLPGGFLLMGMPGVLLALPASELARYLSLAVAERRTGVTFVMQDVVASLGLVALASAWIAIRHVAGLGVPWALIR